MNDLTIITTHFHEFRWFEIWIRQIRSNTPAAVIREILIVNQDRSLDSQIRLANFDDRIRVLEFQRSEAHFAAMGHDHAAVLNEAIKEAKGNIICLFDSDAYPLDPQWLIRCRYLLESHDAVLAACHDAPELSHPCFMVFRRKLVDIPLRFDEGLFTDGIDTGRRVAAQLHKAGASVSLIQPTVGFSGCWGSLYLDSVYHHGSGSFHVSDPRIRSHLTWLHRYFTKRVFRRRLYTLNASEKMVFRIVYFFLYGVRIRTERTWKRLQKGFKRSNDVSAGSK